MNTRNVYVAGGMRTPFTKSMTHYLGIKNQVLMTETLRALVQKYGLQGKEIGDVALGGVITSSLDWNLSRECVLGSGLDPHTPGYNLQRACGTSLEATMQLAHKIAFNQMDLAIAGGVDTNSDLPVLVSKSLSHKLMRLNIAKSTMDKLKIFASFSPADLKLQFPAVAEPRTGLSMGQHCEKMVQEWQVSQNAQDELALKSHRNAATAYSEGFYSDLIFNFENLTKDTFVRADTSMEKLAKLKPAFDFTGKGTITAGNASPLTDGASAVLLTSEEGAKKQNLPLLCRWVDGEVAAVDFVGGEGLLMAPTIAVARLLQRNNLKLQDFDFYEIHEAFAGQVLCTLRAWESEQYCQKKMGVKALGSIDLSKMNVKGGSVAIGHPFAATGTRIVASLAKMLHQKGSGRGLISICTAGGMGVAAILESVS